MAKKTNKVLNLLPAEEGTARPKMGLSDFKNHLIKKKFGDHNKITSGSEIKTPQVIPTGALALDYGLVIGGWPRGRIVHLYGPESSGKTTISLKTCMQVQKMGGRVMWLDAEGSFDPSWAVANGVDMDEEKFLKIEPDVLEDGLEIINEAALNGIDLIILDSLAMLPALKEKYTDETRKTRLPLEKEPRMALTAAMWNRWSRSGGIQFIAQNGITFIIINQIRSSMSMYAPKSVPGGKAVKHMNSISVYMTRETGKDGIIRDAKDNIIGGKFKFTIEKTRFAPIGASGGFDMIGKTIDNFTTLRDLAIKEEIIAEEPGSRFIVGGQKVHGQNAVKLALAKDPELCASIEAQLRSKMGFNNSDFDEKYEASIDESDIPPVIEDDVDEAEEQED